MFLFCLAVPITFGWMLSLVIWALTRDIAAAALTTPLMFGLLTGALGVKVSKKDDDAE
jgi:hypothetical protein